MKIYSHPDVKTVIVCGDIHGNFKGIVHKLCIQYGCTDTLLIVAADCGFGFEKPGYYENIYNQVAGRLRKANNYIVFVRGNHDDPAYFAEERIAHLRWRCVPDYSVIRAWLRRHSGPDCRYVILDDVAEFTGDLQEHAVQLDPRMVITEADAMAVVGLLNILMRPSVRLS